MRRSTFLLVFHTFLLSFSIPHICSAQLRDSVLTSKPVRFSLNQLTVPASLIATGIFLNNDSPKSIRNWVAKERNERMPEFHSTIDNYLLVAPVALAYGLDAFGVKSKTDILNRTVILLKGEIITHATVCLLKSHTNVLRPDGSNSLSFPSGHTAQAFAAATFLSEEYKDRFKWMPYVAYGMASGVGALRIANNKHYISDVLLGAGIGILSMKVAYWTHQYRWGQKKEARKTLSY